MKIVYFIVLKNIQTCISVVSQTYVYVKLLSSWCCSLPWLLLWESVCSMFDFLAPIVSSMMVTCVTCLSPVTLSAVTTPLSFTVLLPTQKKDINCIINHLRQTGVTVSTQSPLHNVLAHYSHDYWTCTLKTWSAVWGLRIMQSNIVKIGWHWGVMF